MRKGLSIEELGDLLDRPFNATLATYRRDGSVLLSPVWHEWRDGGFSIFTAESDVKLRHIQQQGQAAVVVSDNELPFRGIEVSGSPTIVRDAQFAHETFRRIANRYLGQQRARVYMDTTGGEGMVVIRLVPGRLRTWDFADDFALSGTLPEK
ncbi:MAG: TIGR03618 family F420-dependent PPOX class oxidoreductase [Chloroflexota bacterium]|nr:TIGR03618 family F420-dependent PPOX class oxidoreductase [Chloroflexota bacterium]